MPSIADMLVQSGLESSKQAPDIGGSIQRGVELAQHVESIKQQRAQLELAREQNTLQKVNRVMEAFQAGTKFTDKSAQNAYFKNYLPGMIKALKVEDVFSPEILQFASASSEVRDKILGLQLDVQNKINDGELRGGAILAYVKGKLTPEELAQFDGQALLEQQKFATSEGLKTKRAEMNIKAQEEKQKQQIASTGQVAAAKGIAKEFADYQAAGGKATVEKNLEKLKEAAAKLESGAVKTGKLSAAVPGLRSDVAQDVLNPDLAAVRDDVRGAVQATLRQVLGAQFTEKEGEAIFSRAFNPRLSGKENARRIEQEIKGLQATIKNKEAAFGQAGLISPAKDLSSLAGKGAQFRQLSPGEQKMALADLAKKHNVSIDEIKKALGVE